MMRPDMETIAPVETLKTRVIKPPEMTAMLFEGPAMLMLLVMVIGPEEPDKLITNGLVMRIVSPEIELETNARKVPGPESAGLVTKKPPAVWNDWSRPFTRPPSFVATARKW